MVKGGLKQDMLKVRVIIKVRTGNGLRHRGGTTQLGKGGGGLGLYVVEWVVKRPYKMAY
jgi:hypothetical protein